MRFQLSSLQMQLFMTASEAKSAVVQNIKTIRRLRYVSYDIFFKLFDSHVQPILLSASEIWGMECCDTIESVHLSATKRLLNVPEQKPITLVYGETGSSPK